jgi:hypothetical protein
LTIAAIIVLALILLGYLAGYRAGKAAALHPNRPTAAVRR